MNNDSKNLLINKKVKIFIVEDHEVFRMGIKELINQEKDFSVCGESDNARDALKMIKSLQPDIIIIDIMLKDSNGIDLIIDINKLYGNLPILVLSMHDESLYAERSLNAGARGYIMKQETSASIIKAIRHIIKGNIYVSESIMGSFLKRMTGHRESIIEAPVNMLSNREVIILQLIGEGKSSGDIAKKLNLSVKTIGTYRERIKEKLNLKNAAELTRFAIHWVENSKV